MMMMMMMMISLPTLTLYSGADHYQYQYDVRPICRTYIYIARVCIGFRAYIAQGLDGRDGAFQTSPLRSPGGGLEFNENERDILDIINLCQTNVKNGLLSIKSKQRI